jgi:hypothetical protein
MLTAAQKIHQATYYQRHREKRLEANKQYRLVNPEKWRDWPSSDKAKVRVTKALWKYGITRAQFDSLPGFCQICGSTENLVIDHCHDKNRFRGRLCNKCNMGLGMFDDDMKRLQAAAEYIGHDQAWPVTDN